MQNDYVHYSNLILKASTKKGQGIRFHVYIINVNIQENNKHCRLNIVQMRNDNMSEGNIH